MAERSGVRKGDPQEWRAWYRGTVPAARHAHTSVIHDGSMVVFGGFGQRGVYLSDVFRLNFETRTWDEIAVPKSALPLEQPPAVHSHSAVVYDGAMWVFGGTSKQGVMTDSRVHRLSFASGRWAMVETHGHAPQGRSGHSACVVGGEMMLFGGMSATGDLIREIHALDFATLTWRRVEIDGQSPMISHHHAACSIGHSMFVFGGYSGSRNFGALFRLDVAVRGPSKWVDLTSIPGAPVARRAHTMTPHGNALYVFGGRGSKSRLCDLHRFDTCGSGKWSEVECDGEWPSPRAFHTAVVHGTELVVFGGASEECFNDIFFLPLPEADTDGGKSPAPRPPEKLGTALGTLLDDGLFSDVQFRIVDSAGAVATVKANRCILAARSEHFRALFTSGMAESQTGAITLEDVPHGPFVKVLRFLYMDKLDVGNGEDLVDVLVLADRFMIDSLRCRCESVIGAALTTENAQEIHRVAVEHNCHVLAAKCEAVIASSRSKPSSPSL